MKKRTPPRQTKTTPVKAVGVLIPVEWDSEGNPVGVALSAQGETEYLIDLRDAIGKELLGLLQEKIEVSGTAGKIVNNRAILKVDHFRRISA